MIREVVLAKRMPPWHADPHYGTFSNDRSLTADEMGKLMRWYWHWVKKASQAKFFF
jgi:hypothetical protein